jgi:hypothetical protein
VANHFIYNLIKLQKETGENKMLKRITKVTSLLVAASIISIVPAAAEDVKRYPIEDGKLYHARSELYGTFIDAEINGEDEAVYYVHDGKYTKLDGATPGDTIDDLIDDKYLKMDNGDYYVDITTGERIDEDIDGNNVFAEELKLRRIIKRDDEGRFNESNFTGTAPKKDLWAPIYFGWGLYHYELKNPLTFGGYKKTTSDILGNPKEGTYFDGDLSLGKLGVVTTGCAVTIAGNDVTLKNNYIKMKNTEDTYEIEDIDGHKYELKALITVTNSWDYSHEYFTSCFYRPVNLSIWIKENGADDSTYTNITDKVEFGSSKNHHAVPLQSDDKYGYYTPTMQKMLTKASSDDIDGIKYSNSTEFYFSTDEDGVDETSKLLQAKSGTAAWSVGDGKFMAQTLKYKSRNGYNYIDLEDAEEVEVAYADYNDLAGYAYAISGNFYCISDGYIKCFDPTKGKFENLYKVDKKMNKISLKTQYKAIVWNSNNGDYSIIDLPLPWLTAKTDTTTTTSAAVSLSWKKNADGTWNYVKADGTKATGWVNDAGNWYYLNETGIMQIGWINDRGNWYYCNASGMMLSNTTVDGYVLGVDGAWVK